MKNNKIWYKILSTLVVVILFSVTISSSAFAKFNVTVPGYQISDKLIPSEQYLDAVILDESISDADVEILAKSLELITGAGQVTEGNKLVGFNKQIFEKELRGIENYEDIIKELEQSDLFVEPTMSTYVVACEWHLMKKKPAYIKAHNTCITNGIKANYGPVTVGSSIVNLIADKNFTLAAKKILALGVKSNVAGVVFTLSSVLISCSKKMEKQFPGKTNCY